MDENERFGLIDDSSDKKYFTMLPNYILNHSTAKDLALYCHLKRFAGENGTCIAGIKTLSKKLGFNRNTVKKSLEYLIGRGWIKEEDPLTVSTQGGPQKVRSFSVVDIWGINMSEYSKGGSKKDIPLDKGGSKKTPKGGQNSAPKKNHINNIQKAPAVADAPSDFNFKDYLEGMHENKSRHIQIIAFFFQEKGMAFSTLKQVQAAIRRHLRPAQELSAFTDEQITRAASVAKREYPSWTVETLLKIVTR